MRLWEQQSWSGQQGPILVTRSGEIMDASGVISGGQVREGQGLLERRREVVELERARTDVTMALEQEKQRRLALQAVAEALAAQIRQVADSLRHTEMQDLSLKKDEETLRQVVADLDLKLAGIEADIGKGAADQIGRAHV